MTLSRTPRLKTANICEAHLVPADDALLAPTWIPWADRVQPGDLEPSMVLPRVDADPRLMPGYEATGDEDIDARAIWELGLGRERVLAPYGRDEAAERWYRGSHGPTAASAIASTASCSTCAFFVPLSGSLRTTFGACTNEWSPSDGSVVSVDHGCGAHSQTDVDRPGTQWPANEPVYIDDSNVPFDLAPDPDPEPEPVAEDEVTDETSEEIDEPVEAVDVVSTDEAVDSVEDATTEDESTVDVDVDEPAVEAEPDVEAESDEPIDAVTPEDTAEVDAADEDAAEEMAADEPAPTDAAESAEPDSDEYPTTTL